MRICATAVFVFFLSVSIYAADAPPSDSAVGEKIPIIKEKVSVRTAMLLDILPGGGHFYLGNYGSGMFFGILKTGSAASVWYFYSQWQDTKKKYHNASADQADKYKLRSDRAAQRMTFSVIGSVVIQAASWIKVYSDCQDLNSDTYPTFTVGFRDENGSTAGVFVGMSRKF